MADKELTADTPVKGRISPYALAMAAKDDRVKANPFTPYQPAPGVLPAGHKMAMDDFSSITSWANGLYGYGAEFVFPGYPALAKLSVLSEYRSPTETIAADMTRAWIEVVSTSEDDLSDKIKDINAALVKFQIKKLFHGAALLDGFFGLGFIHVGVKGQENKQQTPLVTIGKGTLTHFSLVEPQWCSPIQYSADDPFDPTFYNPSMWSVMGRMVSATRMVKFISRPVPDIMKPGFNFSGISLSQLMEPYVAAWLSVRGSVRDLVRSFSLTILSTDMNAVLSGAGGEDIIARAKLFNNLRDSRGLMLANEENETVSQLNTPLSSLDSLLNTFAENLSYPCHVPSSKLLGITPSGLNASAEFDIKIYHEYLLSQQEVLFREPLARIIDLIQLDLFGEVNPEITFNFCTLEEVDAKSAAEVRHYDAKTAEVFINAGIISPEEERTRLAKDDGSSYHGLDVDDLPEPPEDPAPPKQDRLDKGITDL